jgi:hypothetical protein
MSAHQEPLYISPHNDSCDAGNPLAARVKSVLLDQTHCYVVITCGKPSKEGKMNVEMFYEGDPVLASYLIDSASNMIDDSHFSDDSTM